MFLEDGRKVIVPLAFYPTLAAATPSQRRAWRFLGGGTAITWDEFDLRFGIDDFVAGRKELVPPPGYFERLRKRQREQGMELPPGVTWAMVEKNPRRNYWR